MTHLAALREWDHCTIPFRALLSERTTNLMFAGSLICADPVAFASVRGVPQCVVIGQAAGTAAAMAIRDGCFMQKVDRAALVRAL
ncbi:MAG: FAD-dependent oxidoreductase [Pseudomonadota bacterium]